MKVQRTVRGCPGHHVPNLGRERGFFISTSPESALASGPVTVRPGRLPYRAFAPLVRAVFYGLIAKTCKEKTMNSNEQYLVRVERYNGVSVTIYEIGGKEYLTAEDIGRCLGLVDPKQAVKKI